MAHPYHPFFTQHRDSAGRDLPTRVAAAGLTGMTAGEVLAIPNDVVTYDGGVRQVDGWITYSYLHCAGLMVSGLNLVGLGVAPVTVAHPVTGDPVTLGVWAVDLGALVGPTPGVG